MTEVSRYMRSFFMRLPLFGGGSAYAISFLAAASL
jgi:hypothetical protein